MRMCTAATRPADGLAAAAAAAEKEDEEEMRSEGRLEAMTRPSGVEIDRRRLSHHRAVLPPSEWAGITGLPAASCRPLDFA